MTERTSVEPSDISIVVPVHDERDALAQCLAAVDRLADAPREVVVALDGGDAACAGLAAAHDARTVTVAERSGPALARNLGAEEASGSVVLFVDSDVLLPPDALARVAKRFTAEPEIDAIVGSYDDQPAAPNFLSQYRNLLHHRVHQESSTEGSTFWGACGAIRREILAESGGFDPRYRRPSIEDIELGYRLHDAGCRIVFDHDLQVTHLKRWTTWQLMRTDLMLRAEPWTRLILRTRFLPDDLNVRREARVNVALVLAAIGSLPGLLRPGRHRWLPPALFGVVLLRERRFFWFLRAKRGTPFALAAAPWHLMHHVAAAGGLVVGVVRFLWHRVRPERPR